MLSPALSLFLLRELPFSRFDFPRWQAVAAITLIGVLVGLDPALRSGTPEMPGLPLTLAIPFMILTAWVGFLIILAVLRRWMRRGGRWDGQEMKETEGAWVLNFAGGVLGGFSGAYGYMTSSAYNRSANPSSVAWGLTRSIVVGVGTGAIRPVNSIGRAFGTLAGSVGYGRIDGFAGSRGWW